MGKPYIVVLGNKGVGKSYLLNEIFPDSAILHSKSSSHVTCEQRIIIPEKDNKWFAGGVDTVGLDAEHANFLALRDLYDKPLVFLLLNNDLRVQTTLRTNCKKLSIPEEDIWVFNSYAFKDQPEGREVEQYERIFRDMDNLKDKVTRIPRPRENDLAEAKESEPVELPTHTAKGQKKTKAEKKRDFAKQFPTLRKKDVVKEMNFKTIKLDIKAEFEKLTLEDVKNHRKAGDGLLTMIAARMALFEVIEPGQEEEQLKTNGTLRSFLEDVLGRKDAEKIAQKVYAEPESSQIGDEKYGDLVEALLHKSFNLHLLEQIIRHGR